MQVAVVASGATKWLNQHRIGQLQTVLDEFGVSEMSDIPILCNKEDLEEAKRKISRVLFRRFLCAVRDTFPSVDDLETIIASLGGAPTQQETTHCNLGKQGPNLTEWLEKYDIIAMKNVLNDLGVVETGDIPFILTDEDLAEVKSKVSRICFRKFSTAVNILCPGFSDLEGTSNQDWSNAGRYQTSFQQIQSLGHAPSKSTSKQSSATAYTSLQNEIIRLRERLDAKDKIAETSRTTWLHSRRQASETRQREKRLTAIRRMDSVIRKSREIDLCFVIDLTLSMQDHWKSIQNGINDIVEGLQFALPELPLRAGFVGYRDHVAAKSHSATNTPGKCSCPDRIILQQFTGDLCNFDVATKKHAVSRGNGKCADVHGGLHAAVTELDWCATTRILYHIGDEPCHGKKFHKYTSEEYPNGDPTGLDMADILRKMDSKNIMYFFGKIYDNTDIMMQEFQAMKTGNMVVEQVNQADAGSVIQVASDIISRTASKSVSATSDSFGLGPEPRNLEIIAWKPSWTSVAAETCEVWVATTPTTLAGVLDASDECDKVLKASKKKRVKVSKHPFARGGVRFAFYARFKHELQVAKSFASDNPDHHTWSRYTQSLISYVAANYFANAFNLATYERHMTCPRVEYVVPLILKLSGHRLPYFILEPHMQGTFLKFNNNSGYVLRQRSNMEQHDIIQTFSHWTYHHSEGYVCVVDCQGIAVEGQNKYRLTDPALHCKDILKFDGTNRGLKGMKEFFSTHKCNHYCNALGLRHVSEPSAS